MLEKKQLFFGIIGEELSDEGEISTGALFRVGLEQRIHSQFGVWDEPSGTGLG